MESNTLLNETKAFNKKHTKENILKKYKQRLLILEKTGNTSSARRIKNRIEDLKHADST